MTMEILTPERTIELLREVVDEFGTDYVYPEQPVRRGCSGVHCYYVHADGTCGCVVAQVLTRAGATLAQLAEREGETPRSANFTRVFGLSAEVASILAVAQELQDNYQPYGEMLRKAEIVGLP